MRLLDQWLDAERRRATDGLTGTTLENLCAAPNLLESVEADVNGVRRQEFGYELLLSDVSRAYCGYDSSYFENADEAIEEAAQARKKVLSREKSRKPSVVTATTMDDPKTKDTLPDDKWVLPSRELTEHEFEMRLRDLRSRFSASETSARATSTLSSSKGIDPVVAHREEAENDAESRDHIEEEDHNKILKVSERNLRDKLFLPTEQQPLVRNDAFNALQRAFTLAQQPVEPALQFPPLDSI